VRVVVTGATGNVGSRLVEVLLGDARVEGVTAVARRASTRKDPRLTWAPRDVARDDLAAPFTGADALVHLAWKFQPTHDPVVTWAANAVGTARVLDAAARAGVRTVVVASSVGAYSPTAEGQRRRADEAWPTHGLPHCAYGREKAYCERLLDAFAAGHPSVRVVRLRPSFIFGRHAASEQRRIFAGPFAPNLIARPGVVPLLPWPRGLCFQALHVDDAVEAYRAAVFGNVEGAFNVAAEPFVEGSTMAGLLGARLLEISPRAIRAALATAWHLHLAPADAGLFDLVVGLPLLDTARARRELRWQPSHSPTDALRELLEGVAHGTGSDTPPLRADSWRARVQELRTGVGARDAAIG
jgi:nucleoside-diphosphate-sugar epimerase